QPTSLTSRLAAPSCPDTSTPSFVAATEPNQPCDQSNGLRGFFSRVFGLGGDKALPPPPPGASPGAQPGSEAGASSQDPKKKKGFFGKIAGIFKDDKSSNNPPPKPPDNSGNAPH